MSSSTETLMKRFIKTLKDGDDTRKLHAILSMLPKEDFMAWRDDIGQDAMHYAILTGNAEAVDYMLKLGYFVLPHEPEINMYAHLAARLGFRTVLTIILHHRPEDFKVSQLPLFIPRTVPMCGSKDISKNLVKEPELIPAVVGSQLVFDATKHRSSLSRNPSFSSRDSSLASTGANSRQGQLESTSVDMSVSRGSVTQLEQGGDPSTNSANGQTSSAITAAVTARRKSTEVRSPTRRKSSVPQNICGISTVAQGPTATSRRDSMSLKRQRTLSVSQKRRHSSPEESTTLKTFESSGINTLAPLECTPLEVAALSKHIDCVKKLLDMYVLPANPEKGSKGYLTLATLANDLPSLRLMIQTNATNGSITNLTALKEDYRTAVEVCLQNSFPQCLDLLLGVDLVEPKQVFKHINFFHVLYSQSFTTYKRLLALSRLPAVTELLIRRSHDVKARVPPRTYPLYSLLHGAFSCSDFTMCEFFVTCMKLLVACGADPNYDEVEFEQNMYPNHRQFHGRPAYSSALHCLVQCVDLYRDKYGSNRAQAVRFAEDSVDVLMSYKADIEKIGTVGSREDSASSKLKGDVLCQLAHSSVTLGLEKGLLRCLMRYGAQPQRKINGMYALNLYLDRMCTMLERGEANRDIPLSKYKRDLSLIINLMCNYMAPWHVKDVQDIFTSTHRRCQGEQHTEFAKKATEELEKQRMTVRTLRNITAWQVWKLCGRNADRIKKLPVAKEIKTNVLPLVLFQTMW